MNKKQFDKRYVGKKIVVNCKTEDLANQFLKLADKFGYKWRNGKSYTDVNYYNMYEKDTCYNINGGIYGAIDYCKDNNYKIIEFSDLYNATLNSNIIEISTCEGNYFIKFENNIFSEDELIQLFDTYNILYDNEKINSNLIMWLNDNGIKCDIFNFYNNIKTYHI